MDLANILNSIGVVFILLAFILLTLKKVNHSSVSYNVLNLIGSALAAVGAYMLHAVPFTVLNVAWACVAVYALAKKKSSEG